MGLKVFTWILLPSNSVDVLFCNTHWSPFVPLVQSQFSIIILNSACGLSLTFPLLKVECQLVLSISACFVFPARSVERDSFLQSWMGGRISPLLSVTGQVLLGGWIGRRVKWCCPVWLLSQSCYWHSIGCLIGSRASLLASIKSYTGKRASIAPQFPKPFCFTSREKFAMRFMTTLLLTSPKHPLG